MGEVLREGFLITNVASSVILLFEHDLFGKPVSTFPDHALARTGLAPSVEIGIKGGSAQLLYLTSFKSGRRCGPWPWGDFGSCAACTGTSPDTIASHNAFNSASSI